MSAVVHSIARADGRSLAYEVFGDERARPVVLFHGSPGSRRFRPPPDVIDAAGVRVVTYDRPGYGRSDSEPDRRVADAADDVRALLDELGIERAALVGWSGGGPFAVATARYLPARVTHLAIVSAPGPLDEVPSGWESLGEYRRPTAEMARQEPPRSVRSIARHMEPFLADPPSFLGLGRGPDGDVMRGPAYPMLVEQVHEALVQGAAGIAADLVAMWLDWGFRLAEVVVPTTVFHGAHDRHNHDDARCYASLIPNAELVVWPDAGHLGVVSEWPAVFAYP
jgi:pimeloyl-ACP methyl ester carboxylesterase